MKPISPNFQFLTDLDPALVKPAAMAERYCLTDPSSSLAKIRLFAEFLAKNIAARIGIYTEGHYEQAQVLKELKYQGYLDYNLAEMFHSIRKAGNDAIHEGIGTTKIALQNLRFAHQLSVHFFRVFKNNAFKPGAFQIPPNPADATQELKSELEEARNQIHELVGKVEDVEKLTQAEIEKRKEAENDSQKAWTELDTALELAQQTEEQAKQEVALYEEELERLQLKAKEQTENEVQQTIAVSKEAASQIELTEADTRKLIDQQLSDAGWEVDTEEIRFSKGVRPEKGKNKAIAEWQTQSGPADYVLFVGLKAIAIIEAKKQTLDVSAAIDQAKRYSRDFKTHDSCELSSGPWGEYSIPFVFSTNGRPFLRQMETQSGIWFCDLRRPQNLRRPLESWYTPAGLTDLNKINVDEAEKKLDEMSFAFDFPIRYYQKNAIVAVENTIKGEKQQALLAMATGTGKTKTCIALIYRFLKAQRFKRILFLVDRSALGEQAANAFKDTEITGLQKFADIFAIKELKDKTPDRETSVQISTIQGMVHRILYAEDESEKPKADQYDCIIVDECHRGYLLDREMSDDELSFRSLQDYVSKYRRVLDYFDAFKVGLTATPALHTSEIFGDPVFNYSYREAVLDNYLVDHEPPYLIKTNLSEEGIHWKKDEELKVYDPNTGEISLHRTPDELDFEVAGFNKKVITPSFNKVVCEYLAKEIDPSLDEKTLIFCANDRHADLVVELLKKAFQEQYGEVEDDAVIKITGASDKPLQLIRRFRNERLPSVAVTVDLLTTGIDVPPICNLVFIRRVNSRILYEQMLGRATRKCDEIDKEVFRIYDAVNIYESMGDYSDMKPVVNDPRITFEQLERELKEVDSESMKQLAKEQFIAKLQRKKRHLDENQIQNFETKAGLNPDDFIKHISSLPVKEVADWFIKNPNLGEILDQKREARKFAIPISDRADSVKEIKRGYGDGEAEKPEDYIEGFQKFIFENTNEIAALKLIVQRPRELTRKQLKELQLQLEEMGYREQDLKTAYKATTNVEIAAGIIGFIRQAALGDALIPWEQRVDEAVQKFLSTGDWTKPQQNWLKKIAAQMKKEIIVDKNSMNTAQFREAGGFNRINRVFDGKLEKLLEDINELVWEKQA
jgi:type I restriction enzyme, R subunit